MNDNTFQHIIQLIFIAFCTIILILFITDKFKESKQLPIKVYYEYNVIHHKIPEIYGNIIISTDTIAVDTTYRVNN